MPGQTTIVYPEDEVALGKDGTCKFSIMYEDAGVNRLWLTF